MSGLFGNGGGTKTKNVTQSTVPTPYPAAKPGWDEYFKQIQGAFKSGALNLKPWEGQSVAPTSPETAQGWAAIAQRAQDGSPLLGQANQWVSSRLDPSFLTSQSPELQAIIDQSRQGVNAEFSRGGRTFSGAHAGGLAQSEGQLRYQDLLRKAGEAQSAAQFAPQLAQQDYFDAQQLLGVGEQRQAQMQDLINAEIERFNALQGQRPNELSLYADLLGGLGSGGSSTTSPVTTQKSNGLLTGLGTAATLASLFL